MFNVYAHDKKLKEEKSQLTKAKKSKASEQNRDILTARYKDRINTTLLKLNKDTKLIPKQQRAQTAGYTQNSSPNSRNFHSEFKRIKQSENHNQWLDTTPSQKQVFKLRPRDKTKEIQPSIKFKAKSGVERLEEHILKQKEYLDSSAPPDSNHKCLYKNFLGIEKPVFSGGKEILNYYHYKTHFKALESLALDLHSSLRNLSRAEVKKKHNNEKFGISENKKKNKDSVEEGLCKEDIMPISEGVLEKFGIWEMRKPSGIRTGGSRNSTPRWVSNRIRVKRNRVKALSLDDISP
ncbi:hypothetical protein SteCoe_12191 [Stentor coeruleus]|uniref:Uncharacterized protein n=1 Tax=Stentor coeruleus TaxID=5963 RepID=A0A1R2CBK1_9CILI|nr:hypothetical protein SteCoe_12191 [Stentor coeruleus]